jgi:hypothetical protein
MKVGMPGGDYTGAEVISALSVVLRRYYKEGPDKWDVYDLPGTREYFLSPENGGTVHYRDYAGLRAELYTRTFGGPRGIPRVQWVPKQALFKDVEIDIVLTLIPLCKSEICREFEILYSHVEPGRESEMPESIKQSFDTLLQRFLEQLFKNHKVAAA